MNDNGLISIITPVYNVEKYLNRCINSILNQTYFNFELFLIDDGSTDKSGTICDEYAIRDSRIKVIHKSNEGQAVARNVALDLAKGQYIAFIDSDDYVNRYYIEHLLEALITTNSDMAVCGVINNHVFIKKECPKTIKKVFSKKELIESYIHEPYIRGVLWNKLYRKSLFDDIRFTPLRAREDADILYKIYAKCDNTVYIPEPLYIQLIRPGSTEGVPFNEYKLFTIEIFKNEKDFISKNIPEAITCVELLIAQAYADVLLAISKDRHRKLWMDKYVEIESLLKVELEKYVEHDENNNTWYDSLVFISNNRKIIFKKGKIAYLKNAVLVSIKKILLFFSK